MGCDGMCTVIGGYSGSITSGVECMQRGKTEQEWHRTGQYRQCGQCTVDRTKLLENIRQLIKERNKLEKPPLNICLKEGDMVYYKEHRPSDKLSVQWLGPYHVIDIDDTKRLITLKKENKFIFTNLRHIRHVQNKPPRETLSQEGEIVVSDILG
ncbi:hypothetical protein NEIRO03_2246 [Nematocida sp. AWRm78]|nr:hypothetical protein NEIRO02_2228 [Nematocida sp. AWRm79]KAI5186289.1 hypothetical protein NEIRO03_2246 [Nematocida sp. AWRm78]